MGKNNSNKCLSQAQSLQILAESNAMPFEYDPVFHVARCNRVDEQNYQRSWTETLRPFLHPTGMRDELRRSSRCLYPLRYVESEKKL